MEAAETIFVFDSHDNTHHEGERVHSQPKAIGFV